MEARIITDRRLWDDFVSSSTRCNITQSYNWGELASHVGAYDKLRVAVVDDAGHICAAMLVLVSQAPVIKQPYFYAPRGPIIEDPDSPALTVLLNYVKVLARKYHAFMLKIEPHALDGDVQWLQSLKRRGFLTNPHPVHIRHEWVLDIRPDEKELLAGMKEKWRYNIRLATRKGVTIRRGESQDDIDAFYRLYETTSARDLFFINSKQHYQDVLRLFGETGQAVLYLAEYEGKPIAGTITASFGRWSWYMYGASANEQRERMPNHLLQWTSMQWAKEQGCWYYNFRGIPNILEEGQELWGVYLFKRGFGGYPLRFLQTHDLVYNPIFYQTYRRLLDLKHWRDERREMRLVTQTTHLTKV